MPHGSDNRLVHQTPRRILHGLRLFIWCRLNRLAGCWGRFATRKAVREVGVAADIDCGRLEVLMLFRIALLTD
ncbi:hypothetical protein MRX96_049516 [Rhipicephalus microplus]